MAGRWVASGVTTSKVRLRAFFFFQAEDGIRDSSVTGVQTCALPISRRLRGAPQSTGTGEAAARAGGAARAQFGHDARGYGLLQVPERGPERRRHGNEEGDGARLGKFCGAVLSRHAAAERRAGSAGGDAGRNQELRKGDADQSTVCAGV